MTDSGAPSAPPRIDLALVLNDPRLTFEPVRALSLAGPKVAVEVTRAVELVQERYTGVSPGEVDDAIRSAGGDRRPTVNLDVWPAVKRWLGLTPKNDRPEMYWVPLTPLLERAPRRPPRIADVAAGCALGGIVGAVAASLGAAPSHSLAAGGIAGLMGVVQRWRREHLQSRRQATFDRHLQAHQRIRKLPPR